MTPVPPRPRAVVFDMDGLMFNTELIYWHVGSELLARRGRRFTKGLADAMTGLQPQPSFEAMIRMHGLTDSWEDLAAESEAIFFDLLDRHVQVMPGLMDLLDALEEAAIPKAIGSSSSRRAMTALLDRFRLGPRFVFTLAAEDVARGKPDPEVYLTAAERFGLPPREVMVLEDSQAGCWAAAAAGAIVVAVPGEHSHDHDFTAAAMVVDSLADARLYGLLRLRR